MTGIFFPIPIGIREVVQRRTFCQFLCSLDWRRYILIGSNKSALKITSVCVCGVRVCVRALADERERVCVRARTRTHIQSEKEFNRFGRIDGLIMMEETQRRKEELCK